MWRHIAYVFVCLTEGGTETEDFLEKGAEGDVWDLDGVTREWRKLHNEELRDL